MADTTNPWDNPWGDESVKNLGKITYAQGISPKGFSVYNPNGWTELGGGVGGKALGFTNGLQGGIAIDSQETANRLAKKYGGSISKGYGTYDHTIDPNAPLELQGLDPNAGVTDPGWNYYWKPKKWDMNQMRELGLFANPSWMDRNGFTLGAVLSAGAGLAAGAGAAAAGGAEAGAAGGAGEAFGALEAGMGGELSEFGVGLADLGGLGGDLAGYETALSEAVANSPGLASQMAEFAAQAGLDAGTVSSLASGQVSPGLMKQLIGKVPMLSSLFGGGKGGASSSSSGTGMFGGNGNDFLSSLLGTGIDYYGSNKIAGDIKDAANTSAGNINALAGNLAGKGKFTPYNITTGAGSTVDNNGTLTSTLSAANQGLQQQTQGLASNLYTQAANFDPEAAAKKQFDATWAVGAQDREKQRLDLENRMLQQGRLGMSTGPGGAAPELTALSNAEQQAQLQAAAQSRQQAFDRQNQLLTMGNGMFNQSMTPDKMMLDQMGQSISAGGQRSNAEMANNRLQADLGLNAEKIRYLGAQNGNDIQAQALSKMLQGVRNGTQGMLGGNSSGAGPNIQSMLTSLLQSGMNPSDVMNLIGGDGFGAGANPLFGSDYNIDGQYPSDWYDQLNITDSPDFDLDWSTMF